MRKTAMTPDAFPHRGTAAPFRVAIGLALAASAGMMLWGVGTHSLSFASETPMTLDDRVAALTAELAQVKAETAKLRESQGDTSEELSHMRASLANETTRRIVLYSEPLDAQRFAVESLEPELVALGEVVDLHDDAVDLVVEVVTVLEPVLAEVVALLELLQHCQLTVA